MLQLRTLVHALVILLAVNLVDAISRTIDRPALAAALRLLDASYFLPFAGMTSALLSRDRPAIIIILACVALLGWPFTMETCLHTITSISLGGLLGMGIRAMLPAEPAA